MYRADIVCNDVGKFPRIIWLQNVIHTSFVSMSNISSLSIFVLGNLHWCFLWRNFYFFVEAAINQLPNWFFIASLSSFRDLKSHFSFLLRFLFHSQSHLEFIKKEDITTVCAWKRHTNSISLLFTVMSSFCWLVWGCVSLGFSWNLPASVLHKAKGVR